MSQKYDSYGGSSGGDYNNVELRFTPKSGIDATLERAFGTNSDYGQSLGVNFSNARLEDGALYYLPDGGYYKLFSWEQVEGFMPNEFVERGDELHAEDADEIFTKTYFGDQYTYELVAARVPEVMDDDGNVLLEASSRVRELQGVEDGVPEFSDWEDLNGDKVPIQDDLVTWWDGNEEYGPSTSATSLLEKLTVYGQDSVVDEDDIDNWLPDTTGENILRDDLEGRVVNFFIVRNDPDGGNPYNLPILIDLQTSEEISVNNRGGDSGNENSGGDSQLVADAREADSGDYPEPIAEFIQSGTRINMTRDRADKLLDELVADETNAMTMDMVEDYFGDKSGLIDEVV